MARRDPAPAGSLPFVGTLLAFRALARQETSEVPRIVPDTPSAPKTMAPYSPATEAAGLVFLSGQVGLIPSSGDRAGDDVSAQAHQVMSNIGGVLGDLGLGYRDIVKATIFLADIADFTAVNDVYASYFEDDFPARTTVQAAALPGGFLVEIEVVAAR